MDSTFIEDCVSVCPYISTKFMGVYIVTSTDESKVKTVARGKSNAYDQSSKWKIAYVPLDPVADYINMLN